MLCNVQTTKGQNTRVGTWLANSVDSFANAHGLRARLQVFVYSDQHHWLRSRSDEIEEIVELHADAAKVTKIFDSAL